MERNKAEQYMQRCLDLAIKGNGFVSPNPMVGAVLVHHDVIIGEGWHQQYGGPHAEVNCLQNVKPEHQHLIKESTLYVSLEPCAHYGKTPPCADLIVQHRIPKVIIGCKDDYHQVAGKGIQRLLDKGITVEVGVLEQACKALNKAFFTRQAYDRPYILLKWAESSDGYIAPSGGRRVMLSNVYAQHWVHQLRRIYDAILVGYRTALQDNPQLNNRSGMGKQPTRIVLDWNAKLPENLHFFNGQQPTIVFNTQQDIQKEQLNYKRINDDDNRLEQVVHRLPGINSVIIEGGAQTLQAFIDAGLWDEAMIIRTPVVLGDGVVRPILKNAFQHATFELSDNKVENFYHERTRELFRC
jgi:diaminohydroxyphosphoribosylaminopyrimidine deaminase/5-amino-6-(5-phosphoribosylamino)uracil reductase